MSAAQVLAVIGGLTLAAVIGVSDAPNAIAALVSGRTLSYPAVAGWSFGWHLLGGLLSGVAVARTVVGLVHVPASLLAPVLAAGCWSAVTFTWLTTRRGLPTSASVGLVGGLAGAGLAARGWRGVFWGGIEGYRLVGVLGVLAWILLAPVLSGLAALVLERLARRASLQLPRAASRPVHATVWAASAAVAVADGTNDVRRRWECLPRPCLVQPFSSQEEPEFPGQYESRAPSSSPGSASSADARWSQPWLAGCGARAQPTTWLPNPAPRQ